MAAYINRGSWLNFARLTAVSGVEVWGAPTLATIVRQPDDIEHVFSSVDRVDTLADLYYGDPGLDWLIMVANGKMDFVIDFVIGEKLIIPSPRYVFNEVLRRSPP
jgi:hypothetical protein